MKKFTCRGCRKIFTREHDRPSRRARYCTRNCALRTRNATCEGYSKTKLFAVWTSMIQRCENKKHRAYRRYGGRGIKVCKRWRKSFLLFRVDVGEPAPGMTIDRYPDKDGDYKLGNVRWATRAEQAHNTKMTKLTAQSVKRIRSLASRLSNTEIAELFDVSRSLISMVVNRRIWRDV